jgi:predicted HNH restriction endonuclease
MDATERYTVIAENDESQWQDQTGVLYHFPKRYREYLRPGTQLVYYKGDQKNPAFESRRLSPKPHYFGFAIAGNTWDDPASGKGDHFVQIIGFRPFTAPVLAKSGGVYIETIPESRAANYWRDGVRPIDEETYKKVKALATLAVPPANLLNDDSQGTDVGFESGYEGQAEKKYVTKYERDPALRKVAITLHGTICRACGFDFGHVYGETGAGFIHIHHIRPISEFDGPTAVNPATDLVPVCANCHAIIHRDKFKTLTVEELKSIIDARSVLTR